MLADPHRRLDAVAQHAHVREEVELLEQHPGAQANLADLLPPCPSVGVQRIGLDLQPVDLDAAHGRLLEEVQAADEGRLAGA